MNKAELIAEQLLKGNINKKQWGSMGYNAITEGVIEGGAVDTTVQLQLLVNKAIAEGRRTIFLPHVTNGQYRVTALTNVEMVDFVGDNCTFVGGYDGTISDLGAIAAVTSAVNDMNASLNDISETNSNVLSMLSNYNASVDLFDKSTVTDGIYIQPDGSTAIDAAYAESDFIRVMPGETLTQYNIAGYGMHKVYYDQNKNYISGETSPDHASSTATINFVVPNLSNVYYMRCTVGGTSKFGETLTKQQIIDAYRIVAQRTLNNVQSIIKVVKQSKWYGKKTGFVGDSITNGYGTTKTYREYLDDMYELVAAVNYGINGSSIANGQDPMYSRVLSLQSDLDLIFVLGGTNDFANFNVPIGNLYTVDGNGNLIENTDTSTFYGALHVMCKNLLATYPNARIVLATPLHREVFSTQPTEFQKNPVNFYIKDYVAAIKEIGKWYSVPVCDLWNDSGLNPNISQHKDLYFHSDDGLHPNALGHQKLADVISKFLETI